MATLVFLVFLCFCSAYAVDKVFFVDQINFGIYYSDIRPGELLTNQSYTRAFFEYIRRPGVMTYDFMTNMVIWGQRDPHKIGGDILDGVPTTVDIVPGVKPFCIAFNEVDRRIYWFGEVSGLLNSIRINGTGKIRLAKFGIQIYGLSVDGSKGFLYFAESDRIVRMKVDGSEQTAIVDTNLANVTAFTRNSQDDCLYWINGAGSIERYDIMTNERSTLANISTPIGHVEHIVVYNGVFYWADNALGGIGHIELLDPSNIGFEQTIAVSGTQQSLAGIKDMKVFIGEEVDPCSSSPCGEGTVCVSTSFDYDCQQANNTATGNSTTEVTDTPTRIPTANPCDANGEEYPCDELFGICVNNGTALCSCYDGYHLAIDGVTCIAHTNCSHCVNGECVLSDGIYKCVCDSGFRLGTGEYSTCEDINECESAVCDPGYGECMNTVGAYYCSCVTGFVTGGNGLTCQVDCNENSCQNGGTCEDNMCYCPDDFEGLLCEIEDLETETDDEKESSNFDDNNDDLKWKISRKVIIIIIVVILLIILLSIVIIVVCCRCKKDDKVKGKPDA